MDLLPQSEYNLYFNMYLNYTDQKEAGRLRARELDSGAALQQENQIHCSLSDCVLTQSFAVMYIL